MVRTGHARGLVVLQGFDTGQGRVLATCFVTKAGLCSVLRISALAAGAASLQRGPRLLVYAVCVRRG